MSAKRIYRSASKVPTAFEELVKNAIEFLTNALDEFGNDPNRSVIDFYTAVELFLKARLLQEHWILVVGKDPNREKFRTGDFVSVTFEEALKRLRDVVGCPLSEAAAQSFDSMRRHRNRMVHFYHDASSDAKSSIALGQLQAWFHLNRLLTKDWAPHFNDYTQIFSRIDRRLVKHREYASAKFSELKEDIARDKAKGIKFASCRSCGFKAAKVDSEISWRPSFQCQVCRDNWMVVKVDCPECETSGIIHVEGDFKCGKCNQLVQQDEIYSLLDDSYYDRDQLLCGENETPASCDECQGYETVCEHKKKYLCVNCFEIHKAIYACGWCSGKHTSIQKDSYYKGCEHCDGNAAYYDDE